MPDEKVRGRKKHPEGRPPIVKKFGLLIRRLRKEAGLSQEEFAYRAKYHRTYQTFIESGAKTPSIETARKQAEVLNLRLSQLFALLEDDEGSIHN
ncbi:MAG: XRE family transcriptional regulator [Flavobacterium sp.]|nr:MAG: XRE family transcriptional regulator [Flavobacterium sp.]